MIAAIVQNTKFNSKGIAHDVLKQSLGDGLLFSSQEKWFARRRAITPTFHFKILEEFFEVFKKHSENLMEEIDKKVGQGYFDIMPIITDTLINTLCETAMGCDESLSNKNYIEAVPKLLDSSITKLVKPEYFFNIIFYFSKLRKKIIRHSNAMRDFTTQVISKRRKELENRLLHEENLANHDDDDVGIKKKACLLDVLLRSTINNKPLSNDDISEEVDNFMFAGQETTTNAICFTLYLIAKHENVQQKIYEEIEEVIGDEELTFKSLSKFNYLELVIKESLRLFPPVPLLSRKIHEEVEVDGCIFPANTNFVLLLYRLFRNPKIYEKPNDFIPERFESSDKYSFSYIPFSAVSEIISYIL